MDTGNGHKHSTETSTTRPILVGVEVSDDGPTAVVEVELQIAGRLHRGVAARPEAELEAAAASATLRAVEAAKPVSLAVTETMYARAGAHMVAVVVVDMAGMRRPLTGSALIDEHPEEAFARAALDSINRIVTDERLLTEAVRNAHHRWESAER